MAVYVVTTLDDENDVGASVGLPGGSGLSLREALTLANDTLATADTITFDGGLIGGTIYLSQGTQLEIASDVTIEGGDSVSGPRIFIDAGSEDGDDAVSRVLMVSAGTANVEGLLIAGGYAGSDRGGGIFVASGATLNLSNSAVLGNSAGSGGGIYNYHGTVTIVDSVIVGNTGDYGAGINNYGGALDITRSVIGYNFAYSSYSQGGGISSSGTLNLRDVIIYANGAAYGGGIYIDDDTTSATIVNTAIAGNMASRGGGLYVDSFASGVLLTNVTMTGNIADEAGAIFIEDNTSIHIRNSLVLGNSGGVDQIGGGTYTTDGISIIGGAAEDVFAYTDTIDPDFIPASGDEFEAGLLQPMFGGRLGIALLNDPANPALDAGEDSVAPTTDALGFARFDSNAPNNGANISDLGAFELSDLPGGVIAGTKGHDIITPTRTVPGQALPGASADLIVGLGGHDLIDGGGGADEMYGGAGDDTYVVDDIGDLVFEDMIIGVDDGGNDLVKSWITYTLGDFVERLTLLGNADNDGTGNAIANVLTGNSGANVLTGLGGNDTLKGGGGVDTLYGGAGIDTLDGGSGADRMYGGSGNDVYIVDNVNDRAIEDTVAGVDDGGSDLVKASVTFTIDRFIERLTLTGSGNIDGTGNAGHNVITGNASNNVLRGMNGQDVLSGGGGADRLIGGQGADTLTGGTGADTFVFNVLQGSASADTVTDFEAGTDRIQFQRSAFAGLAADAVGAVDVSRFTTGSMATMVSHRLIYDQSAGALYYDVDGAEGVDQVLIATFSTMPVIGTTDIFLF